MVQFSSVEGAFGGHQVQLPDNFGAHQKLLRAVSKYSLNTGRHRAPNTSLGSLLQPLATLTGKQCPLLPSLISPIAAWCQWCPGSRAWHLPLHEVASQPLLLQAGHPEPPQPLLTAPALLPLAGTVALLWEEVTKVLPRTLTSFSYCGAQNCTQYSEMRLHEH